MSHDALGFFEAGASNIAARNRHEILPSHATSPQASSQVAAAMLQPHVVAGSG
jgi:hypothetical protein